MQIERHAPERPHSGTAWAIKTGRHARKRPHGNPGLVEAIAEPAAIVTNTAIQHCLLVDLSGLVAGQLSSLDVH